MKNLQRIAGVYKMLLFFNIAMLIATILVFPEQFLLLRDPISWLGKVGPGNALNFYISYWLFSAGLIYNVFRWNQIISLVSQYPVWEKLFVRVAFRTSLFGFILMLFPCDRFSFIHDSGGALVGLGMWAISSMMLIRLSGMFNIFLKTGLHLILHSTALFCIISFALNSPMKGFSQRPAILAIVIVTLICLQLQLKTLQGSGKQHEKQAPILLNRTSGSK